MDRIMTLRALVRHAGFSIPARRLTRVNRSGGPGWCAQRHLSGTSSTKPQSPSIQDSLQNSEPSPNIGKKRFAEFDLAGRTFVVTGGAQGLGLTLAEGLVEAGGNVHCLDCAEKPSDKWLEARSRVVPEWGGALRYSQVDVTNTDNLNRVIGAIANEGNGIHGAIAAAGIQQMTSALDYTAEDAQKMLNVNYTGVFMTATAVAREMIRHNCRGSVCLIGSISASVANRGLIAPAYNSSKAAVVQLARCLAMEWAEHGIRVNTLSPGHMLTPMVQKNFEDRPELRDIWKKEIMLGRFADPSEFKGAALFLLSGASSFVTGSNMIVDGGHTAW